MQGSRRISEVGTPEGVRTAEAPADRHSTTIDLQPSQTEFSGMVQYVFRGGSSCQRLDLDSLGVGETFLEEKPPKTT